MPSLSTVENRTVGTKINAKNIALGFHGTPLDWPKARERPFQKDFFFSFWPKVFRVGLSPSPLDRFVSPDTNQKPPPTVELVVRHQPIMMLVKGDRDVLELCCVLLHLSYNNINQGYDGEV